MAVCVRSSISGGKEVEAETERDRSASVAKIDAMEGAEPSEEENENDSFGPNNFGFRTKMIDDIDAKVRTDVLVVRRSAWEAFLHFGSCRSPHSP